MTTQPAKTKYFATIDDDGKFIGFYPSDIWPKPPEGAREITEDQYRQFFEGQAANPCVIHRLINDEMIPFTPKPPPMTVPMSYAAAIVSGLIVSSASDAIATTTVSLAMQQLSNLANVSIYIHINKKFPGGQDTFPLFATDGSSVDIPTPDLWQEIATAAADYVAKCDVALKAGMDHGTWAAPSNLATIS